ncbi:hypothetical protein OG897_10620 [Streptomyces sp. NBC_00237]|uniref:hypothetical protein n=1 Tax=Streptomyces sp. NBC_00237 TaxID=2975687 RepID=UPI0022540B0E|nr:hypothetical protein [Streptomyces sp. NBC_00237]MCX5201901.1 hypothetical protein [Streptomyces sp. NBC_00237]
MEQKRTSATAAALAVALASLLAASAVLTGCDSADPDRPPAAAQTPSFPPLNTKPPAQICADLTSYWVHERLAGRGTGDYMKEGMSNAQNNIVVSVMAAARKEKARAGDAAAEKLIAARTKSDCAERYRGGKPTEVPWH